MSTTYTGPLHILRDSGVPKGSSEYTTVVIVHGYAWHSGIFSKLIPLADAYNIRIILLNRRDYPGAQPYTAAERALLLSVSSDAVDNAADAAVAKKNGEIFLKERAREIYEFLVELVRSKAVHPVDPANKTGGIVIAGWSFGTVWMLALLTHVASFSEAVEDVDMTKYMRRVVLLDPPHLVFGYPMPSENPYNPLFDPEIPPNDRDKVFANWVSGYYVHGDTLETLERKTPLRDPPPTLSTLTHEEIARTLCLPPGAPGGSDAMLLDLNVKYSIFATLREGGLYTHAGKPARDQWADVEVCHVSCEQSVWERAWGNILLEKDMSAARVHGLPMRDIRLVSIKGANHFVQWDTPELTLRALVGDEDVVVLQK
ncbi:hypothetical protein BC628DRAFT_1408261 [Trametes gibbosa]|nr:hypothetical protein BC628DRAFT_1408261 [Trametes gibbosa]